MATESALSFYGPRLNLGPGQALYFKVYKPWHFLYWFWNFKRFTFVVKAGDSVWHIPIFSELVGLLLHQDWDELELRVQSKLSRKVASRMECSTHSAAQGETITSCQLGWEDWAASVYLSCYPSSVLASTANFRSVGQPFLIHSLEREENSTTFLGEMAFFSKGKKNKWGDTVTIQNQNLFHMDISFTQPILIFSLK